MKERPIIFLGEMVRAILDGRKTQTRRVVKKLPPLSEGFEWSFDKTIDDLWEVGALNNSTGEGSLFDYIKCPYGIPGDRLWVRETWSQIDNREFGGDQHVEYKADTGNPYPGEWPEDEAKGNPEAPKWKPSIFMPRWASRIMLEVTDIRVEMVQDISEEDAKREGVLEMGTVDRGGYYSGFADLWDAINAKRGYGWDVNPFVWVVGFKVVP